MRATIRKPRGRGRGVGVTKTHPIPVVIEKVDPYADKIVKPVNTVAPPNKIWQEYERQNKIQQLSVDDIETIRKTYVISNQCADEDVTFRISGVRYSDSTGSDKYVRIEYIYHYDLPASKEDCTTCTFCKSDKASCLCSKDDSGRYYRILSNNMTKVPKELRRMAGLI